MSTHEEVLQRAQRVAEEEKQRVLEHIDGRQLTIEFGRSWQDSKVEVNGEELSVYGVDLAVDGGDMTRIELRISGKRLMRKIVVKGTLHVFDVTFEDTEQAIREITKEVMSKPEDD